MTLAEGRLIGDRYRLTQRIAVGGMGEVWRAADLRLGRSVAVKVLKAELGQDPEFLDRFRVEARTTASINHRNIAQVHDYGEDTDSDGQATAYLVMELVHGEPLSTRLAIRGRLGPVLTLDLLEQAGRALAAAHARGYVHRDVKPGNILLADDGTAKLTDFGIAKAANTVGVTKAGMVMGTAHYIAPEQAKGDDAGPASDIYSLGVVGYECLAGHRPFQSSNTIQVALMHINDPLPALPLDVLPGVRSLIEATLAKDPTQRYRDGAEFVAAVAAVRRGQSPPTPGAVAAAPSHGSVRPIGSADPGPSSDGLAVAGLAAPGMPQLPGMHTPPRSGPLAVPTRSQGPSALTITFVLLTVAAVIIGVLVVRNAISSDGRSAAVSPPAPPPPASSPPSLAPPGTVLVSVTGYTGRSAAAVVYELQSAGLSARATTTRGAPPRAPADCSVTDVTPTGTLTKGSAVTVTCEQR